MCFSKNYISRMIRAYFKSLELFTDAEIDEIVQHGQLVTYNKGDYFLKEGEVSKSLAFINSGLFRSYYHDRSGNEITYCFSFPRSFTVAYTSYVLQEPSDIYIQALSPATLFVLPKISLDQFQQQNTNWLLFQKQMIDRYFMALERRVFEHQRENAENRYANLLKKHPEYIQQVPLQYIASYLGITLRHLSRIRAKTSF